MKKILIIKMDGLKIFLLGYFSKIMLLRIFDTFVLTKNCRRWRQLAEQIFSYNYKH